MRKSSIKFFWDKKNEREDSDEYLKNIKFTYQTDYKAQKTAKDDKSKYRYRENVHRILFRQNLREKAKNWYFDLRKAVKSDWTILKALFKTQFEMKTNAETNKYLLLQRMITLMQRSKKSIIDYFRRIESLIRHLSSSTETIDYNMIKNMKHKSQRKRVYFECNKNRNFFLKKIKQVIQTTNQTINIVNSFDLEWRQRQNENSFNLIKEKNKIM
jgi:hypothetical protein